MPGQRSRAPDPIDDGPSTMAATFWLLAGLGGFLGYFLTAPSITVQKPPSLVALYIVTAIVLDLFVGASRRVTLQRISPVVVLALLVTPGVPPSVALIADLLATLTLAGSSQMTTTVAAQAGRSLLPAVCTAFFLSQRQVLDLNTYFFASEVFLLVSLMTRTTEAPFRADLFLVVSFPAIALMLRSLSELHLAYILLTLPLLFLLTTVDTEMLRRYFQLQKKLDSSQSEIKETRRARQMSERESRRKGVLLDRREKQIELLNGLGRQLDDASAVDDLARFLLQECYRLTGAEVAIIMFADLSQRRITRIVTDKPPGSLGLKEGDPLPPLIKTGLHPRPFWKAAVWQDKASFLTMPLGGEGWLMLAHSEADAFPAFLEEFFSAVGRHAGSTVLAMRRLTEVREMARREAHEKNRVAAEKEKVAEQNQNLRSLIHSFDNLTGATLNSDVALLQQGAATLKELTGASEVVLRAPVQERSQNSDEGLTFQGKTWPSFLYLQGSGPTGNILCLASERGQFTQAHLEWCTLLRDFLDKTLENGTLHRRIKASLAQLEDTQQEVVRSSQWAAAGRLAANAAHELNTPLGAIRLAAEQVSYFQGESTPEPAKLGLASIIRSVDRCREVTDRLLITSRPVDAGDTPTRPVDLKALPILRDAVASMQPYMNATKIKLATHRLNGDQEVLVVLQDLYWAVINIMKNGVDALNEFQKGEKRLAISLETRLNFVVVTISDNGPGISDDLQEKIFEPFFTTKKIGQGNGLGLALSRQNLRKWGGDVHLVKTGPDGTTFAITVPLSGTPEARRAEQSKAPMTGTH